LTATNPTPAGGLRTAAEWICKNTADPRNSAKPFSFKSHEYQIGILNDTHPFVAVRKATQCGQSEASVRLALAICAKFSNISAIYVLPSIRFATKFSMARCDPVIEASRKLKALANRDVSSSELKKIGSSFLYFTGAAQNSSAISIPARALIADRLAHPALHDERPLTGHGLGSWPQWWRQNTQSGTLLNAHTTPHNEYLLAAAQAGVPAALLLLAWLLANLWASAAAGAVPALMVWTTLLTTACTHAVLRDAKLALPLLLLAAVCMATVPQTRRDA
jgi:hypothetical protein